MQYVISLESGERGAGDLYFTIFRKCCMSDLADVRETSTSWHSLSQNRVDRLTQIWQQCCDRLAIDPPLEHASKRSEIDRVFKLLVAAYTHPDRHYHSLQHIYHVFAILDRFSDLANPSAVYFAAWFHDFIYDPQAVDNEIQSARAAKDLLANLGADPATIDRVSSLILATEGHKIDPTDRDLSIFLDADLAILGTPPVIYQAYQQSIRREYSWVSDAAYQTGRIRVLESFLTRDRLYHTELLFNELESIARLNLEREIDFLSKG
jgi:predicted metal-dependent HD superfamily phosphohydrolase